MDHGRTSRHAVLRAAALTFAGILGISCLSGCAGGLALAVLAVAAGGGGGGGGGKVDPEITSVSVTTTELAQACPEVQDIDDLPSISSFVSGDSVCLNFTLEVENSKGEPSEKAVPVELALTVGGEPVPIGEPGACTKYPAGSHCVTWDSTAYGVSDPAIAILEVRAYRECSDTEPADTKSSSPFLVDNRPTVDVLEECSIAREDPAVCAGISGRIVARYRIRSLLDEEELARAVAASELLFAREEGTVPLPAESTVLPAGEACCGAEAGTYCLELRCDTRTAFPDASTDGYFGLHVQGETSEFREVFFFPTAPASCPLRHINNSTPSVVKLDVASAPEGVRNNEGDLVGHVLIQYEVEDAGAEDCIPTISARFQDRRRQTVILDTASGSLSPLLAPENDLAGPLQTSVAGNTYLYVWNSDHDIDRLVREGRLDTPFLPEVRFSVSVKDTDSCLESSPEESGIETLDNRLVHTVAGIAPSQPAPGTKAHPRDGMVFGTLWAMDADGARGTLYLVDLLNHSLWSMPFTQAAGELTRVAGNGTQRYDSPEIVDGEVAARTALDDPIDVSILGAGDEAPVYLLEETGALWNVDQGTLTLQLILSRDVLYKPAALTAVEDPTDGSRKIYVADTGNCRVLEHDLDSGVTRVILGTLRDVEPTLPGYPVTNGCDVTGEVADALDRPGGVAFHVTEEGRRFLFISDSMEDRIRSLDLDGNLPEAVYTLAEVATSPFLCRPKALRIMGNMLYVVVQDVGHANQGDGKGLVLRQEIVLDGDGIPRLASEAFEIFMGNVNGASCEFESNPAPTYEDFHECFEKTKVPLSFPTDVIDGPTGNIFVCDGYNRRVWMVGGDSGTCVETPLCEEEQQHAYRDRVTTFLGSRIEGREAEETFGAESCADPAGGPGDLAARSKLNSPLGLAFVDDRALLIADRFNERVRRVDLATGLVTTIAGRPRSCKEIDEGTTFDGVDLPAVEALLAGPSGLLLLPRPAPGSDTCASGERRLYLTDQRNHRVRRIGADGIITTCAGSGEVGMDCDLTGNTACPAQEVFLKYPMSLQSDSRGRIFITDRRHRILVLDTYGLIRAGVGVGLPIGDLDVVVDPGIDPEDGVALGDGGPAREASLYSPDEMVLDRDETHLYFADTDNNRIRRAEYDIETGTFGIITTVVGNGATNPGLIYGPSDDPAAVAFSVPAGLDLPAGSDLLYFTEAFSAGHVYVLDVGENELTLLAGGPGFRYGSVGDGDRALNARLFNPFRVCFDGIGNLYVADSRNHRVRRFWVGR